MQKRIQTLLFFTIIFLVLNEQANAQRFLVLEKMGTKKRFEFNEGDNITYQLKDQKGFRKEEILAIGDTALVLASGTVPFSMINRIDLRRFKGAWLGIGSTLILAGVIYLAIDYFNERVVSGNPNPGVDSRVATGAGVLMGTGAVMVFFSFKKVKVKKNWRLRVVDIYGDD